MTWVSASVRISLTAVPLCLVAACAPQKPPPPKSIGEAYVVPESLDLRHEIPLSSGVAGTARRGERVDIVARRRRFVKVRTGSGAEGWTDDSQLLTPEMQQKLEEIARQTSGLPSQGVYRARDTLNVHFEPARWSPTFYRLHEDETFDLLGRRLVERTPGPLLSDPSTPPSGSLPIDEWRLIRTREGHAGWVLGRMTDAAIPDEVAQYAEGRRITSYFALSEVVDGPHVKKVWLWTTTGSTREPYDFDSIRVFNWGRRRHRYETAHIERGLRGYYPVQAAPQVETRYGRGPGFSILVEKSDGGRYRRRYVMIGHLVRMYAEEPALPEGPAAAPAESLASSQHSEEQERGFFRTLWERIRGR